MRSTVPAPKSEPKKVLLRLDPAVHEAIAKWAADDLRSINSQIEYALRLALEQVGRKPKRD
ncbi:toxin-antitoxin system HicB family antitoxin [Nocardia coubleae]|uniref:Toxin-antitoxin system HicB family antitoxin n=1 Tax=Nocardia coubleae TaxID=356147 RepID=A0A846WD83_9NOCA|nr:toxin-antitoxin system HicB family antitoxin [Nocardia coubleae]